MQIIKDQNEWLEVKKILPAKYNLNSDRIVGYPTEYPCYMHARPGNDVNGMGIFCNFFYNHEAQDLLDVSRKLYDEEVYQRFYNNKKLKPELFDQSTEDWN